MEKLEQNSSNKTGNEVGKEFPPGQEEIQTSLTRSDKNCEGIQALHGSWRVLGIFWERETKPEE